MPVNAGIGTPADVRQFNAGTPAEHVDQSIASLDEKLRRFLGHIGDTSSRPPYVYFHYDGFPRRNLAEDALAFLADIAAGRLIVSTPGVPPTEKGGA